MSASPTERLPLPERLVLTLLLPLTVFALQSYCFVSFYSRNVFTPDVFRSNYYGSIYRYRVLGRELVLWTQSLLTGMGGDNLPLHFRALTPELSPSLFLAHFVVNGIGFVAFCGVAFVLLVRMVTLAKALPLYLLLVFGVPLTFFVITPYDALSYLLLLLAVLAFHTMHPAALVAVVVATGLGALTRETAAVGLAYMFSVAFLGRGEAQRTLQIKFGASVATFIAVYVGLRLVYGFGGGFLQDIMLPYNANLEGLVGFALMAALLIITEVVCKAVGVTDHPEYPRALERFYLASIPYLLTVFLGGLFFEVRLIVPLMILHLMLACYWYSQRTTPEVTSQSIPE